MLLLIYKIFLTVMQQEAATPRTTDKQERREGVDGTSIME